MKGTPRHVVTLEDQADRYTIDGVTRTAAELTTTLAESAKTQPAETVVFACRIRRRSIVCFGQLNCFAA